MLPDTFYTPLRHLPGELLLQQLKISDLNIDCYRYPCQYQREYKWKKWNLF